MLFDMKRTKYIQLDFRIETVSICYFISLSGLQKITIENWTSLQPLMAGPEM